MTARGGPTERLLIVPALLLVMILATVVLVGTAAPLPVDDGLEISEVADSGTTPPLACHRGRDGVLVPPAYALADGAPVTSGQVVDCPVAFDGRHVSYTGEVVGDLLRREGGAWVLVNDDDYALQVGPLPSHREHRGTNSGVSVWLPDELGDALSGLGRPNQRGDVVRVEGSIRRTDPADGGGLTLRAEHLEVLRPAQQVEERLHRPQALLAAVSLLLAIAATGLRRARRT